jgi:hypothetical protein
MAAKQLLRLTERLGALKKSRLYFNPTPALWLQYLLGEI